MISKPVFFTVITQFSSLFTGILASILTAHVLGPMGRGDYFFITTLAMLITQFSQLGLASSNTYLVARDLKIFPRLLINSIWVSIVVGVLAAVVVLALLRIVDASHIRGGWILILLAPISMLYLLGGNLLVGIHQIKIFNMFQFSSGWLICLMMLVATILKQDVDGFLYFITLGWIIIVSIMCRILLRYVKKNKLSWKFSISSFQQGFRYGTKAYIVTLIGLLILRGNILILKYYTSSDVLGFYSIAGQLSDCLNILPTSVGLVIFPRLISGSHSRWLDTKRTLLWISLLMFIACVLTAFLARPFIGFIFGDKFLPAVPILLWMLPGSFFLSIITVLSQYLASIGLPRQLIFVWFIGFIVVIMGGYFLVPLYKGVGAAMTFSLAYSVLLIMISILVYDVKKRG